MNIKSAKKIRRMLRKNEKALLDKIRLEINAMDWRTRMRLAWMVARGNW